MRNLDRSALSVEKKPNEQEEKSQLRQWLSDYFYQRVIPLERRYIGLLHRQIALLKRYRSSPELTTEQADELSDWINQLKRTISSRAFILQAETLYVKDKATHKALFETNLWYLFGGANRNEIKRNLDKFCRSYDEKIIRINAALTGITSPDSLKSHLKQRQKREARTISFIEESHHYYLQ